LAIAWSHAARYEWTHNNDQDGNKYAKDALEEIEAPLVLSGDNPFVLTCCFYVFQTAAEFMEADRETNQLEAKRLSTRLSRDHRDYAIGSLIRAQTYQSHGDTPAAEAAWKDMLKYGNGKLHLWPAAAFLNGSEDENFDILVALQEKDDDGADLARAYVLALSEDDDVRREAIEIFERLKSDTKTWFGRHTLVQIPLLAGEPLLAKQQCREWIANASVRQGIDNDSWWEKESLQFIASGGSSGLRLDSDNPGEKWFTDYQRGMLSMSNRQWDDALEHFAACNEHAYYPRAAFRRFWTMALEEHLQRKLGKPRDVQSAK
jgi:hypothetical protein